MSEYTEQADNFLKSHGITFAVRYVSDDCPPWCAETPGHIHGHKYRVTFRRGQHTFGVSFWNSYNDSHEGIEPSAYDVLASIEHSDPGTLEGWCSNLGYSPDSIKANVTYRAVKAQWTRITRFFTPAEIEELQEIA